MAKFFLKILSLLGFLLGLLGLLVVFSLVLLGWVMRTIWRLRPSLALNMPARHRTAAAHATTTTTSPKITEFLMPCVHCGAYVVGKLALAAHEAEHIASSTSHKTPSP